MEATPSDPRASGAARAAPGGYKVDISRGERTGRVSSEWFSRPDDERFLSLGTLHAVVRTRAERATARTVETRTLRVEANRDDAERLALIVPGHGVWISVETGPPPYSIVTHSNCVITWCEKWS